MENSLEVGQSSAGCIFSPVCKRENSGIEKLSNSPKFATWLLSCRASIWASISVPNVMLFLLLITVLTGHSDGYSAYHLLCICTTAVDSLSPSLSLFSSLATRALIQFPPHPLAQGHTFKFNCISPLLPSRSLLHPGYLPPTDVTLIQAPDISSTWKECQLTPSSHSHSIQTLSSKTHIQVHLLPGTLYT